MSEGVTPQGTDDLCLVVRAAGERTESLCVELLRRQVPDLPMTVLHERPFAAALERAVHRAIESQARWALFVDADVLIAEKALSRIAGELGSAPPEFFMMNFLVLDRGFAGPAYAGIHAFRAGLFGKALRFMKRAATDQRPETRLCKEMAGLGHPTILSKLLVGLHDHEQYLKDLYRKMFVRGIKYRTQLDYMMDTFRERYQGHEDYRAMLWGLVDGVFSLHGGNTYASLDAEAYRERAERTLGFAGLTEKSPLGEDMPPVDSVIESFVPSERYRTHQHWIAPSARETWFGRDETRWTAFRRKFGL